MIEVGGEAGGDGIAPDESADLGQHRESRAVGDLQPEVVGRQGGELVEGGDEGQLGEGG